MTPRFGLALAALTLTTLTLSARADVVADTFGPGDSYDTGTVRVIAGAGSVLFNYRSAAITFIPSATVSLTGIELALRHLNGTNSYKITLALDAGGQPGTALESWFVSPPTPTGIVPLTSVTSVASPQLDAGTMYWLMAQSTASVQSCFWYVNDQGFNTGSVKTQITSGATPWIAIANPDLAFRVSGTAAVAPEPAALGLLALPSAMIMARLRRRPA
jgi:hypothetical protein